MPGYLTPDTLPTDKICRVLFIPNNEEFIANVTGALEVLLDPDVWTKYGTLTPEESANALVDMFDKFCFSEGMCHMIGEIILWSGATAPDDTCLLCDGSVYARVDYPDLYATIDPFFHAGADNFTVPDLRDRVAVGAGLTYGIGDNGGAPTVTLEVSTMPSHSHDDIGHIHALAGEFPGLAFFPGELPVDVPGSGEFTAPGSANLLPTGGDGAHENMQPYLALAYYIVAL
jgi:microcystin-dependent protein